MQSLHELVPGVTRVALLMNPDNPNATNDLPHPRIPLSLGLGLQTVPLNALNAGEIDVVLAELARAKAGAVDIAATDPGALFDLARSRSSRSPSAARRRPFPSRAPSVAVVWLDE